MGRLSSLAVLAVAALILVSAPVILRGAFPLHYWDLIENAAQSHELDPMLIAAVIQVESGYRSDVVSQKGAIGLMQIMPETAAWLGSRRSEHVSADDLFDPELNVVLGTYYLKYLCERFPTEYAALAAYNAGPTNARRWLEEGLWDGSYERSGQIPFAETRSYVRKVIMMRSLYSLLYQ
ncbi:MAG: lytic transglycosylase domain-containing protein [Firmicutes bacterium]|nr:lytic transglycosylase domain-containing protein [Bacillota bacterium]